MAKIATFGKLDYQPGNISTSASASNSFINQLYVLAMSTLEDEYQSGVMKFGGVLDPRQKNRDQIAYFTVQMSKYGESVLSGVRALSGKAIKDTPYWELAGDANAEELVQQQLENSIRQQSRIYLDMAEQGTYRAESFPAQESLPSGKTWGTQWVMLEDWMFYAFKVLSKYEFEHQAFDNPDIEVSEFASASIVDPAYEDYLASLHRYFQSGNYVTYDDVVMPDGSTKLGINSQMDAIFQANLAMLKARWTILLNAQVNPPVEEIDLGRYADIRNQVYTALQDMNAMGQSEYVRVSAEGATKEEGELAAEAANLPEGTPAARAAALKAMEEARINPYLKRDAIYMVDLPMTCAEISDALLYLDEYNKYVPFVIPKAGFGLGSVAFGWLAGERVDKKTLEARQEFEGVYQLLFQYQRSFCKNELNPPAPHVYDVRSTIRDPGSTTDKIIAKAALHQWVDTAWSEAERGGFIDENVPAWVVLLLRSGQYADDLETMAAQKRQEIHDALDLFAKDPWNGPIIRGPDGEYLPYTGYLEGEDLYKFWINRQVREAFRDIERTSRTGAGEVMRAPYADDMQIYQNVPDELKSVYTEGIANAFNIDLTGQGGQRTDKPGYYVPSANTLFALVDWLRTGVYDEYLAAFDDSMWKSVKDEEWEYFRTFCLSLEGRSFVSSEQMYSELVMPELNKADAKAEARILNMTAMDSGPNGTIGLVYFGKLTPEAGEQVKGWTSGATATVYRFDHKLGSESIGNLSGTLWVENVHGTFGNEILTLPDRPIQSERQAGSVTNDLPGVIVDYESKVKNNSIAFMAPSEVQAAVNTMQELQPLIPTDTKTRMRFEAIFSAYWARMMKVATSTIGFEDDASAKSWASAEAGMLESTYIGLITLTQYLPGLSATSAFAAGMLDFGLQRLNSYTPDRGTATVTEISSKRRRLIDEIHAPLVSWRNQIVPAASAELDLVITALEDALKGVAQVSSANWYIASQIAAYVVAGAVGDVGLSEKCKRITQILNENVTIPRQGVTPQEANQATDAVGPNAATGQVEAQELIDTVKMGGAMFTPFVKFNGMRPRFAYHVEDFEPAALEPMLAEWARPRLGTGIRVDSKCHGFRGTIQCRNKMVRIYLEGDYRDYADIYPEIAKAVSEGPDVTLEAEFMESVSGVLAARPEGKFSVGQVDKAKAVAVVFDILSLEKQHLADSPLYERLAALQRYFMTVMSDVIIPMAGVWANTEAELLTAIKTLADAAGSEGVVLKTRDGKYTIKHETEDWAKVKARMRLSALVLKVNKIKTGGVNYTCGVLRDNQASLRPADSITYRGQKYAVVGATFATPVVANVGDVIEVAVTEIVRTEDENGKESFRWEDPKVIGVIDKAPDGLGRAIQIGAILQASISEPYRKIQEARWSILAAKTSSDVLAQKTIINSYLDEIGNERIRSFAESALMLAQQRLGQVPGSTLGDIGYGVAIEEGNEQMLAELEKIFAALDDALETQPGEVTAQLKQLQRVVNSYILRIDETQRPILYGNYVNLRDRVDKKIANIVSLGTYDLTSLDAEIASLEKRTDLVSQAFPGAVKSGDQNAIQALATEATSIRERLNMVLSGSGGWLCAERLPERIAALQRKLDEGLGPDEGAEGVYLTWADLTDKLVEANSILGDSKAAQQRIKDLMNQVDVAATAPTNIGQPETLGIGEAENYGLSFTRNSGKSTAEILSSLTPEALGNLSRAIYAKGNAELADLVASWRAYPRTLTEEESTAIFAIATETGAVTAAPDKKSVADVRIAWDNETVYIKGASIVKEELSSMLRGNADQNGLKISPVQQMAYEPWMMWLIDLSTRLVEQYEAMFQLLLKAEAGQARLGGAMRIKASEDPSSVTIPNVVARFIERLPYPSTSRGIEPGTIELLNQYSEEPLPGESISWQSTRSVDIHTGLLLSGDVRAALNEYLRTVGAEATIDGAMKDLKVNYAMQSVVNEADRGIEARIKAIAAFTPDTNPAPMMNEGVPPQEAQWIDPSQSGLVQDILSGSPYLDHVIALLGQGNRVLIGFDNEAQGQILASVNVETGDVTGDQNALVDLTWNRISTALSEEPTVKRTIDGIGALDKEQYWQNEAAVKASLKGMVTTSVGGGCNGFYVGPGLGGDRVFITAAHCVGETGSVANLFSITGERITGRVAWTGKGLPGPKGVGQDVAVVAVEDAAEIAKTSQMTELQIGSEYPQTAIVAAPNMGEADVIFRTKSGPISLNPGGTNVATFKQSLDAGLAEYDLYTGYDRARGGYSGSPIIDSQGRVVGLWSGRLGEVYGQAINQRYGRVVPIDVIRMAIEAAGESVPTIDVLPESMQSTLTASQTEPFAPTGEMTGQLVQYKDKGWQSLEFGPIGITVMMDGAGDGEKLTEYRRDSRLPALKDFRVEGEKEVLDTVKLLPSWVRNDPNDYYMEAYIAFQKRPELNGLWAYSAEAAKDYDAPGFLFKLSNETPFWLRKDSAHKLERSKLGPEEKPSLQRIAQFLGRPPVIPQEKKR